jgi:hypothetical protein
MVMLVHPRLCALRSVSTLLLLSAACSNDATVAGSELVPFRATAISAVFAVDPVAVQQPIPGRRPAVAFGESQYLVVWEDRRRQRSVLYGGRIAVDGTSLDPSGIPLLGADVKAPIPNGWYRLAVASDGVDFLVVTVVSGQLRGLQVNAAGELLDDAIVIANALGPAVEPSLLFDGERYLVTWSDDGRVRWARVTPDGTVLDPEGVDAHATA